MTNFLVVNTSSSYKAIIDRPTLNALRVITSTYYLKMKFSTKVGIGEVCSEQVLGPECYVQELKDGEKDVRMVKPSTVGEQFPPLLLRS